jgi:glycosyltransferase involved in cell wall biosynthesis
MGPETVTIGVVVPIYGDPALIAECLDSVGRQSEPFDSVVLVDDTCGDAAVGAVLSNFAERFAEWRIVVNPRPLGIVGSSNVGVEACTSNYVALLDCDDLLAPSAAAVLRAQLPRILRPYVSTRYATFSADQAPTDLCLPELRSAYASDLHLILEHMFLSHLKVVDRSWFIGRGGFAAGSDGVQDWYLALDAVSNDEHGFVDEVLYLHRLHGAQTSGTTRSRFLRLVNERRREFLRKRFRHRNLTDAERVRVRDIGADITKQCRKGGQRPAYFIADSSAGLAVQPASVPILESFISEHSPTWVLVAGDTWVDLGQISKLVDDRDFSIGVLLQPGSQATFDLARWYSGYLDYLVVPGKGQLTALRESLPVDLETVVFEHARS